MILMFSSRHAPYLGPLYIYNAPELWKITQVSLLSGGMRAQKLKEMYWPAPVNPEGGGQGWTIMDASHDRMGLMKTGSLAMGAFSNCPTQQFIDGTMALAGMMGRRVWTEPSMVSTQFSRPYVTNGQWGYVVKRSKGIIDLELRHNKRIKPLTTPAITLSKGGHLLVPMSLARVKLNAAHGTMCDPFAIKTEPKTGWEYIEL